MTSNQRDHRDALRSSLRAALTSCMSVELFDEALAKGLAVLPSLRAPRAAEIARATMTLVDLGRAARALDDVGIRSVVIKGGALLASGRVLPGKRHLDDIDLLVPPADAVRALEQLEARGFRVREGVLHDGTPHRDRATHQLPMMVAPGGTLLELHVHAHIDEESFDDVYADAVDVSTRMPILRGVRVPVAWRLLRQLCAHVVLHHGGESRLWPRHLFDLQAMADVVVNSDDDRWFVVRGSRAVLRGFVDPSAPLWAKALAAALIVPEPEVQRAGQIARVVVRAGKAVTQRDLHQLWPSTAHLQFTGDLLDNEGAAAVVRARWRRWRRLLRD